MTALEISFTGIPEIKAMLKRYQDPELTKRAQRATKAGAKVLATPLRAAVRPFSKRMAKSVWIHVAKRDKPAYIVGHHVSKALFWHMVIGGTKDHSLTPRKAGLRTRSSYPYVKGVPAHPVVAQVARDYGARAQQAVMDDLTKDS